MIPAATPATIPIPPARGRGEMGAALVGDVEQPESRRIARDQPGDCSRDAEAEHRRHREGDDHEALRWPTSSRAAVANVFFVLKPSSRSILAAL